MVGGFDRDFRQLMVHPMEEPVQPLNQDALPETRFAIGTVPWTVVFPVCEVVIA